MISTHVYSYKHALSDMGRFYFFKKKENKIETFKTCQFVKLFLKIEQPW